MSVAGRPGHCPASRDSNVVPAFWQLRFLEQDGRGEVGGSGVSNLDGSPHQKSDHSPRFDSAPGSIQPGGGGRGVELPFLAPTPDCFVGRYERSRRFWRESGICRTCVRPFNRKRECGPVVSLSRLRVTSLPPYRCLPNLRRQWFRPVVGISGAIWGGVRPLSQLLRVGSSQASRSSVRRVREQA